MCDISGESMDRDLALIMWSGNILEITASGFLRLMLVDTVVKCRRKI